MTNCQTSEGLILRESDTVMNMGQFTPHFYNVIMLIAPRLKRYNVRTVRAINILFSTTLHTTPFLYGKKIFWYLARIQ